MAAPFRTTVIEPWIDYNGHLNEGYFAVVFGMASDDLLEQLGFNEHYRTTGGGTFYTVETHIRFIHELALGEDIRIEMRVVGLDEKRIHIWHEMYRELGATLAATQESMLLHVDIEEIRVRPMSPNLHGAVLADYMSSRGALPDAAGSAITLLPPPGRIAEP